MTDVSGGFDIEAVLAEEIAKADALDADADPGESLEESEDDGPAEDDESDAGELSDEEDDSAEGDSGEEPEDEEESEAGEPEPEAEAEEEPEPEPEPNPLESELKELKAQFSTLQAQNAELANHFRQQQQQAQQAQQQQQQQRWTPAEQEQLAAAVSVARFGATTGDTQEEFNRFPGHIREHAMRHVREIQAAESRYGLNPELRYRDQIAQHVDRHVREIVGPLEQQLSNYRAKEIYGKHADAIKGSEAEVFKIFESIPGGSDWKTMERRFDLAVSQWEKKQGQGQQAKAQQRLTTKERQFAAKKKSRRGPARTRGKNQKKKPHFSPPNPDGSVDLEQWIKEAQKAYGPGE